MLNQAAQTAKRSPEFAAAYSSIAKRRGKKIATLAIARKLLTRAWHLLASAQATPATTPTASGGSHRRDGSTDREVAKPRARSPLRHEPAL